MAKHQAISTPFGDATCMANAARYIQDTDPQKFLKAHPGRTNKAVHNGHILNVNVGRNQQELLDVYLTVKSLVDDKTNPGWVRIPRSSINPNAELKGKTPAQLMPTHITTHSIWTAKTPPQQVPVQQPVVQQTQPVAPPATTVPMTAQEFAKFGQFMPKGTKVEITV